MDHSTPPESLIFVYNADSGLFNTLGDIAHKLLSPSTYACNLCAVTHTALGMKNKWREFLEGIPLQLQFLHRDEFKQHYRNEPVRDAALPAIFLEENNAIREWMSAAEINRHQTLEALIMTMSKKLGITEKKKKE